MVKILKDEIFYKLHHGINSLHSLQNCRDTLVMNREGIDERLFEELNNCKTLIKYFERYLLEAIMEDARSISKAAVTNTNNSEKAKVLIQGINTLMEDFSKMEYSYIEKSEFLKRLANQFRNEIMMIKRDMEVKIKSQEEHKKRLNEALFYPITAH